MVRGQACRPDEQTETRSTVVPPIRQTLAFDAAVAVVQARRVRIDAPVDNAVWTARQLIESLFAAYTFGLGTAPSQEAALDLSVRNAFLL